MGVGFVQFGCAAMLQCIICQLIFLDVTVSRTQCMVQTVILY